MSAISSNLTDPNDPYSSLYQLLNNSNQSLSNTTNTAVNAAPPSLASELDDDSTQSTSRHGHHHHGIPSQIEDAVTSALQSAAPGADPNQTIQTAIASVLQQANGQDPTTTTPTSSTNPTTDASTQSATSFNQLLQSFGVDPKQFQQDLQAALQGPQQNSNSTSSGSVDFATLFSSFPPGSAVDTVG